MNPEINRVKSIAVMAVILLTSKKIYAQEIITFTNDPISPFEISGYVEACGSTAFSDSFDDRKPSLFVSHNRNDEPAVNLAFLKTKYDAGNIKANFALAAGTYMRASYAAEPGLLKISMKIVLR